MNVVGVICIEANVVRVDTSVKFVVKKIGSVGVGVVIIVMTF